MFLDEHILAPMMMSLTLIVALGGVIALGAYVVYCDRRNRAGENDLALTHEASPAHADHHVPVVETVEPMVETDSSSPVTARPVARRRRAGAPPES